MQGSVSKIGYKDWTEIRRQTRLNEPWCLGWGINWRKRKISVYSRCNVSPLIADVFPFLCFFILYYCLSDAQRLGYNRHSLCFASARYQVFHHRGTTYRLHGRAISGRYLLLYTYVSGWHSASGGTVPTNVNRLFECHTFLFLPLFVARNWQKPITAQDKKVRCCLCCAKGPVTLR